MTVPGGMAPARRPQGLGSKNDSYRLGGQGALGLLRLSAVAHSTEEPHVTSPCGTGGVAGVAPYLSPSARAAWLCVPVPWLQPCIFARAADRPMKWPTARH